MKNFLCVLVFSVILAGCGSGAPSDSSDVSVSADSVVSYPCIYKVDVVDEFTKEHRKESRDTYIWSDSSGSIWAKGWWVDSVSALYLKYVSLSSCSVAEDGKLMLLLRNDSVVTLTAVDFVDAVEIPYGDAFRWKLESIFYISHENRLLLLSSPVKKIRIYCTDGYNEMLIDGYGVAGLRRIFKCLK